MPDVEDAYLLGLQPDKLFTRYKMLSDSEESYSLAKSHGLTELDQTNLFAYNSAKLILKRDPTPVEVLGGKAQLLYDAKGLAQTYAGEHPPGWDAASNLPPNFTTTVTSSYPYALFEPGLKGPAMTPTASVSILKAGQGGPWLLLGALAALIFIFRWKAS